MEVADIPVVIHGRPGLELGFHRSHRGAAAWLVLKRAAPGQARQTAAASDWCRHEVARAARLRVSGRVPPRDPFPSGGETPPALASEALRLSIHRWPLDWVQKSQNNACEGRAL